ncbi:GNAT family N-acetyltransferase [Dactylosporangium sp. NPDC005572]|uniref:GNAT family N-acetyltransferase n=1 Tax=Dactylosporangium sp. NPDC005572 TaxID=3156889 RepID=UPI0033B2BD6F
MQFRDALPDDAARVAALHADSWRRHYRGAYSDAFLDGDVESDRRSVWSARLAARAGTATILAESSEGGLLGFAHVRFDQDPRWGSLVDNLHVTNALRRTGIGRRLLALAARSAASQASTRALYLWVLEQNRAAQAFYLASGAAHVETAIVDGDPARLNGTPRKLRMSWPDASLFPGAAEAP